MDSTQERDEIGRFMSALSPGAPEVAAPEPEQAAQEEAPQEQVAPDEQPEQEQEPDAGLVELELEDGQTFKVPPTLKDGYLRHADYTKKTQEVALLQKNAHAALQKHQIIQQFQEQTREEQQELMQVQAELKRLRNVDWTQFDTESYMKTRAYTDQLRDKAQDLEKALGQKQGQFQQELHKQRSEATKSAYEFIGRHVKDWTPDSPTERETAAYAAGLGVPPEALSEMALTFPAIAVALHKARQFDSLQSSKGQAVQKAQKAPPVVKPGAVTETNTVKARQIKAAREAVRKDGSVDALERYFLTTGLK